MVKTDVTGRSKALVDEYEEVLSRYNTVKLENEAVKLRGRKVWKSWCLQKMFMIIVAQTFAPI